MASGPRFEARWGTAALRVAVAVALGLGAVVIVAILLRVTFLPVFGVAALSALVVGSAGYFAGWSSDVVERRRLLQRHELLVRTCALVTSGDHETKLSQMLTRQFVPAMADWCAVDLLTPDQTVVRAAAAHRDPAKEISLRTATVGPWQKERAVGLSDIAPSPARDAPPASLAVPLPGRRGVIGVLTLGMTDSGRRLDKHQFQVTLEVARQVALAIENAALARQTAEASRAKDEFLAMLGHELRNPLAPLLTALSLMEIKGYAGLEKEYGVISRQVRHMIRLVDDLLDVTRIVRGKLKLSLESLDLAEAVTLGLEVAGPLLQKKALKVEVDVPAGCFLLRGDRTRLAQVMANLLSNAGKWSSPGQTIEVRASADGGDGAGGIALLVRDHGAGIEPDLLPRVFDLFAQGPQTRERSAGGLGIGLALVKNLVSLHGGSVTAKSDGLGRGSDFILWLPTGGPAATAPEAEHASPPADPAVGRGVHVLIVDDNIDAGESIGEMLDAFGFEVRVVHDGPTALRTVGEFRPEVALLDIGLPGMDGHELGVQLAKRVPGIRLIAVSGYAQPADLAASRSSGFERHLSKPVDWNALKGALLGQVATDEGGAGAPRSGVARPRPLPSDG